MKKITVIAITALTLLAGCGGSDAADDSGAVEPDTSEQTTEDEVIADTDVAEQDESCSLTEQQIGDDTISVVGSHLIDGDELLCSPSEDTATTFAIFTTLIPAEYREGVVAFVAIDQEASDGTDGAMQDVYDEADEATGDRLLALDVTGSSEELERTIVHEVGHTIFITAASEVPTGYAEDFAAAFPPGGSYEENPEDFVTEYAASVDNGQEDMAESWAMFVYADTPFAGDADDDGELDVVEPGTLAADKVAFFEDYPELVELRAFILANSGF